MCYVCTTYLVRHGLTEGIISPTSYLAVFPVSPTTEQTDGRRGTSNKQTCWTRCMLGGMCAGCGDRPIQGTLVLQKNLYMHCRDIYCILTLLYICNMYACLQTQPNKENMHVVLFKQLTHALNAAVHWTALARSIVCLKIIARLAHRRGRTGNVLCSWCMCPWIIRICVYKYLWVIRS